MLVNQGELTKRQLYKGSLANTDTNCEFCTAAGAVNLIPGMVRQTSADAAAFASLPDAQPKGNYTAQAERICKFVVARTGRRWGSHSSDFEEAPYEDALTFMQQMWDKTAFAVYIHGPTKWDTETKPSPNLKSHWLNALKVRNEIKYFDFQTNREYTGEGFSRRTKKELQPVGGANPSSATLPFVGIVSQTWGAISTEAETQTRRGLHSSDWRLQRGIINTSMTKMMAIAFFSGPK